MSNETFLKLSSVVFAVLWSLLMWWSGGLMKAVSPVAHIVFGVFVGALCCLIYDKWFCWYVERQ